MRLTAPVKYLWLKLLSSFWFVPLLIVVGAILAAQGMLLLDSQVDFPNDGVLRYLFSGSPASARSILSTIAAAMIGVAGTVFSITLVALTLASSQFGPRLLQNFMYDRLNQIVLGAYVSTFVYCLMVLRAVKGGESHEFVPDASVLLAIIVAIGNIFLLIIFIHHIAMSIQADSVVSKIGKAMHKSMKKLFPAQIGEQREFSEAQAQAHKKKAHHVYSVKAPTSGFLQVVDPDKIMKHASKHNLILELRQRPGKYLIENSEVLKVYAPQGLDEDVLRDLQAVFILGNSRTSLQDAEFVIHQLVEMAVRALSPGINDPYTAMTCIHKLTAALGQLVNVEFPGPYRFDDLGELRIIVDDPLTFEGLMNASFNQIRQHAGDSPAVLIRMMEAFAALSELVQTSGQRAAVKRHADMVMRRGEEYMHEPDDLADLKKRYRHFAEDTDTNEDSRAY